MFNQSYILTIIIATYNSERYLKECLLSIEKFVNACEVIIIDGASDDDTMKIAMESNVVKYIVSEKDNGVYDAWNKGVKISTSPWILFLGSDDYIYDPQSFRKFLEALKKIDGYRNKIVFGDLVAISCSGNKALVSNNWDYYKKNIEIGKRFIPHPSTCHHKSLFEEYGFFNTSYKIAGDYELLIKYFKNHDAVYIKETVSAMRKGGLSSNPKTLYKVWAETRRARIKNSYSVYRPYFVIKGIYYYLIARISKHRFLQRIFGFMILKYQK